MFVEGSYCEKWRFLSHVYMRYLYLQTICKVHRENWPDRLQAAALQTGDLLQHAYSAQRLARARGQWWGKTLSVLSIFYTKIEGYFYNLHLFEDKLVELMFACLRKVCQCVQPCPRPARSSARHCRHTAARVWDQRQWLPVSTLHQSGLHQLELVRDSYHSSR